MQRSPKPQLLKAGQTSDPTKKRRSCELKKLSNTFHGATLHDFLAGEFLQLYKIGGVAPIRQQTNAGKQRLESDTSALPVLDRTPLKRQI